MHAEARRKHRRSTLSPPPLRRHHRTSASVPTALTFPPGVIEPAMQGAVRRLYPMAQRPLSFVGLPTELKHCVLVHAMGTDNNTAALLGLLRELLMQMFPGDAVGFNTCVHRLSAGSLRSYTDILTASSRMAYLMTGGVMAGFALDALKHYIDDHYDSVKGLLAKDSFLSDAERMGDRAHHAHDTKWYIAIYAGRRGSTHSAKDVWSGRLGLFRVVRDILSRLGIDRDQLHPCRFPRGRTSHLADTYPRTLAGDRSMGVFACLMIVDSTLPIEGPGSVVVAGPPLERHRVYTTNFSSHGRHVYDIWNPWETNSIA